nr:peptidoglycan-binding protein [Desulfuromonadales bacterium]
MRQYRRNDAGEAIRDIQLRLEGLGYAIEPTGHYDDATVTAV